jgi:peptidoglycan-N-acetylglucosamine deacetylase
MKANTDGEFRVALTFDAEHPDRPHGSLSVANEIICTLGDADVLATFFLEGRWARAHPEVAMGIAAAGHLVGSHSANHARMCLYSDEGVRQDVQAAERDIVAVTGVDPRPWFRFPYGEGHGDGRLTRILRDLGYRSVPWDVEAEDWREDQTAEGVKRAVVEGVAARGDGAVILLHTWPQPTAAALAPILCWLQDRGCTFVRIDELGSR